MDYDEPLLREVTGDLKEEQVAADEQRDGKTEGYEFSFGPARPVTGQTNSMWEVYAGLWPVEGLVVEDHRSKAGFRRAFETPVAAWRVRNATQLPAGQVVFQLGDNQVCILEPESRKVARLAFGRGSVVVMQRPKMAAPASSGDGGRGI
jgi:hypothetical protein